MSKYTLIEKELSQINDAKFQLVCNAYIKQEFHGILQSPGSVIGKEKTRKGKPDSFLLQNNGKYLLAEYTTKDKNDKSAFYQKLEGDLRSCLDFKTLGIESNQVNLIVLCCNSVIELNEVENLRKLTTPNNISLIVVGSQELALFLFGKGKSIARECLGVPFDTGQVLSKAEFLKQYGKKNLATPLDNDMVGREEEIESLHKALNESDVVIINGAPGVGKSRIALQAIDEFVEKNSSYTPYYILYKTGSITEDLMTYLELDKRYILFIDDANRQIDNLVSILNNQIEKETNQIKIVVTVRDYAKYEVIKICRGLSPSVLTLQKLSEETIVQILKGKQFGIAEPNIIDRIVKICDGNPRLAIMAARLIVNRNDIALLKDVTNVYDEYFKTFIHDKEIFEDKGTLRILGLISFFHTMDMEEEIDKSIIKLFGVAYNDFVETIHRLEDLEILEVYQKYTTKITEQVLSTYFFYTVFIKKKDLDFSLLLQNYFQHYHWRMKDSFDSAYFCFGNGNVFEKLKEELVYYWEKIKLNKDASIQFLNVFGQYLPDFSFQFINSYINNLQEAKKTASEDLGKSYSHYFYDVILNLLEPHFKKAEAYQLRVALDLSVKYVIKKPDTIGGLLNLLQESFAFNAGDIQDDFARQNIVYDYLLSRINQNEYFEYLYYRLFSHTLLSSHYLEAFYTNVNGKWELIDSLKNLRKNFWNRIVENFQHFKSISSDIVMTYLDNIQYSNDVLLTFDEPFILELIKTCFDSNNFGDCYFVQKYIFYRKERGVELNNSSILSNRFTNEIFKIFQVLTWEALDQRQLRMELRDYDKMDEFKKYEIKTNLAIQSIEDYRSLHKSILQITDYRYKNRFDLREGLDTLMGIIFELNPDLGFDILSYHLSENNVIRLWPLKSYRAIFNNQGDHKRLFRIINEHQFLEDNRWRERYFSLLPQELVTIDTVTDLLTYYKTTSSHIHLYSGEFDKFMPFDDDIYEKVLSILVAKRKEDTNFEYKLGYHFFKNCSGLLDNNLLLCKEVYFQQEDMDRHFDNDGTEFFELFQRDTSFLNEYIDYVFAKHTSLYISHFKHLIKIWSYPDAETIIYNALLKLKSLDKYHVSDHIANAFFTNLGKEYHHRASEFLEKLILKFSDDTTMMNMVFDISRNCLYHNYHTLIKSYLTVNADIESFKKMRWYNNHFSSTGKAIWADFKAVELRKVYSVIKELSEPLKYILHLADIERKISYEEKESAWERKLQFRELR